MRYSELILLTGLALFSGVLLKDSFALDYRSDSGFGPGFIPINFAIVTILLAVLIGVGSLRRARPEGDDTGGMASLIAPVASIVLLFVATFAMEFGSVLAPLACVTIFVSTVFLKHSLPKAALLTAATLATIYVVFSLWLNIPVI